MPDFVGGPNHFTDDHGEKDFQTNLPTDDVGADNFRDEPWTDDDGEDDFEVEVNFGRRQLD